MRAIQKDYFNVFQKRRAAEAPEETINLSQNDLFKGDWVKKTTKCDAKKNGKPSAGSVAHIMRLAWCEHRMYKTIDVIVMRQELESQSAYPVEEFLGAEMTDKRLQVKNSNSKVRMEGKSYAVEKIFRLITLKMSEEREKTKVTIFDQIGILCSKWSIYGIKVLEKDPKIMWNDGGYKMKKGVFAFQLSQSTGFQKQASERKTTFNQNV